MQIVSRHVQTLLAAAVRTSSGRSAAFAAARVGLGSLAKQSYSGNSIAFKPLKTSKRIGGSQMTATALFGSTATAEAFYEFKVKDADGKTVELSKYKGKVVLIVNVASQCGYTPQYKELAALYDKYSNQGFVILGFPCNQFGGQEPGSDAEVKKFAQARGAKFPIMSKVDVNGSGEDPLFSFLKAKQGGLLTKDIKWNFTKFLVDREGNVVKRYGSSTTPLSTEDDIKKLL